MSELALRLIIPFFFLSFSGFAQTEKDVLVALDKFNRKYPVCNSPAFSDESLKDPPSIHGMVLFGSGPYYVSHLPMYHKPHNYQVILEVEPSEELIRALSGKANGQITVVPETFVLPEIVKNAKNFKGQIYDGHFEKGGKPSNKGEFKIKRVVYFREFEIGNPKIKNHGSYLVFGDVKQSFAAKLIGDEGPDTDRLAELKGIKGSVKKDIVSGKTIKLESEKALSEISSEASFFYDEGADLK